jgi:uncharacterized membrane protein
MTAMALLGMKIRYRLKHFAKQIRSNILYGFFLLLPLVTSIFIIAKLFNWMDSWIYLVMPKLLRPEIPRGAGFVILLTGTYLLGLIARNYIGKRLLQFGNGLIIKIPFFNKIYGILKQVVDAIASPKKKVLDKVALIQFPQKGSYCLAFVTSRKNTAISKAAGEPLISVFLPKAPNPATGFLLYLPASEVVEVDMKMETALKLIMSAGVVTPDKPETPISAVTLQDLPSLLRAFKPPKKPPLDPRD